MLVQDGLGLFERCTHRDRDQIVLGHQLGDLQVQTGFKTKIPVGKDPHQLALGSDGNARDLVLFHDLHRLVNSLLRGHRDGVHDHSALRSLHPIDFV